MKTFLHSSWYDTATPYHACQKELEELMREVERGHLLTIESHSNIYAVQSMAEYKDWLKNIFGGGFEDIVPGNT